MKFQYPHLTPGYILLKKEHLTLNSQFYADLFTNKNCTFSDCIILPQRIPKKEFFDEMILLENKEIGDLLKKHQKKIIRHMNEAKNSITINTSMQRSFLNYLNILLRYGLGQYICSLDTKALYPNLTLNNLIEYQLISEIAKFQLYGCNNTQTDNLIKLIHLVSTSHNVSKRIQILVLNYAIVAAYRFNYKLSYDQHIKPCYAQLLNLIKDNTQNDFDASLRQSIAYRGLAMVNEIKLSQRNKFLKQSEILARNIKPKSGFESILAKENLYTCLQTLSKWNQIIDKPNLAKSNLLEMIEIDPFDSTGYAELAFFLLDHSYFNEALTYFKQAAELGPPAVGMHFYYYAKCLERLGKNEEAISAFYKAAKLDEQAVSPLLDLIDRYQKNGQHEKVKKIAKLLLSQKKYQNQLSKKEIKRLSMLI